MSIKKPIQPEDVTGHVFPCTYDIKAMGLNEPEFIDIVLDIVKRHCQEIAQDCVKSKLSSSQKYCSVTITVQAKSMDHLELIYNELTTHEKVLQRL